MITVKDLQLSGGDLVPAGRGFATVDGAAYLQQRIAMALRTPYGSDPYNPLWGSVLPAYIGVPQDAGTPALVASEVSRVLAQLVAGQQAMMSQASLNGMISRLDAADVIASVDSVDAAPLAIDPETITVAVAITTQAGVQVIISSTVGTQ